LTPAQNEQLNNGYVILEGIFRADRHGHMGLFSGAISDIGRIETWKFARR
jgi:hypothetical protein